MSTASQPLAATSRPIPIPSHLRTDTTYDVPSDPEWTALPPTGRGGPRRPTTGRSRTLVRSVFFVRRRIVCARFIGRPRVRDGTVLVKALGVRHCPIRSSNRQPQPSISLCITFLGIRLAYRYLSPYDLHRFRDLHDLHCHVPYQHFELWMLPSGRDMREQQQEHTCHH
jgi:hypothetical protein